MAKLSFAVAKIFAVANNSFAVANIFAVVNNSFAVANQYVLANQQLHLSLISSITLLDFPSNLQNISKRGIRAFLRDNGVNLAFKLHKTDKNHT